MKQFVRLLTGGDHFVNSLWSLFGALAPLVVAVFCIPILLDQLGSEVFGFLAIAWMIVGYFSLFDLGIGRALTFSVSQDIASGQDSTLLVGTGMGLLLGLGCVFGIILFSLTPDITEMVLKESSTPRAALISGVSIVSIAVPLVVFSAGLKGVLEANGRFKLVSLVGIPTGSLMFLLPAVVSSVSDSIEYVFGSLVLVRLVQVIALGHFILRIYPITSLRYFGKTEFLRLIAFGSWLSVSNIVSPIMAYMDRFFIGVKLSAVAVTQYVVPFDMVTKALIFPTAILNVLFPQFSKSCAGGNPEHAFKLMKIAMLIVGVTMAFPLVAVFLFSFEILELWLGYEFAAESSLLLKIFAFGVLVNSIGYVPYGYIQGFGRADLTAKAHLFELTIYIPCLLWFIDMYSLTGAAIAWAGRVTFDLLLLLIMAVRLRVFASSAKDSMAPYSSQSNAQSSQS